MGIAIGIAIGCATLGLGLPVAVVAGAYAGSIFAAGLFGAGVGHWKACQEDPLRQLCLEADSVAQVTLKSG